MDTIKVKCTTCGAQLSLSESGKTAECPYCHNFYVVETAEKLNHVADEKTGKLKNLKKQLDGAVGVNDVRNMSKHASAILGINPSDYTAVYYHAYAERALGKSAYLYDFYAAAPLAHTENELQEIIGHINLYSDLRERSRVETFLMSLGDIDKERTITEYRREFKRRETLEQLYDDIPRDVFVCHSSNNKSDAEDAVSALENDDNICWISTRNLRPNDSENYWSDIRKAIRSCGIFLVVSGADAMISKDVKQEIELARELGKPRLEFKIDGTPHTPKFKDFFDGIKWVDAIGGQRSVALLELCRRVYDEKEKLLNKDKKPNEIEEIKRLIQEQKTVAPVVKHTEYAASYAMNEEALLKKAKLQIEEGDFAGAKITCDKISDINIECAELWIDYLLIEYEKKNLSLFKTFDFIYDYESNYAIWNEREYKNAIKFANAAQKEELESVAEEIRTRKKIAENVAQYDKFEKVLYGETAIQEAFAYEPVYSKKVDIGNKIVEYINDLKKVSSFESYSTDLIDDAEGFKNSLIDKYSDRDEWESQACNMEGKGTKSEKFKRIEEFYTQRIKFLNLWFHNGKILLNPREAMDEILEEVRLENESSEEEERRERRAYLKKRKKRGLLYCIPWFISLIATIIAPIYGMLLAALSVFASIPLFIVATVYRHNQLWDGKKNPRRMHIWIINIVLVVTTILLLSPYA